jgi:Flp pilus assembly protein TadG
MTRPVSRTRKLRGNAMVEFALSVGVFIPMLLGVFQFGYTFYLYNRMVAAVRSGARYAALRSYDSATSTPSNAYTTAVQNTVVYGNPAGGTSVLVPNLSPSKVSVSMAMVNGVPDMVTVYINDFTVDAVVKTMHFTGKPMAAFRYEGRFAAP